MLARSMLNSWLIIPRDFNKLMARECERKVNDSGFLFENQTPKIYTVSALTEEIKDLLEKLAEEGYRSLSQQCEMAIIEWLKERGHLKEKTEN